MNFITWIQDNRELAVAVLGLLTAVVNFFGKLLVQNTTPVGPTVTASPLDRLAGGTASEGRGSVWGYLLGSLFVGYGAVIFPCLLAVVFRGFRDGTPAFPSASGDDPAVTTVVMSVFGFVLWSLSLAPWALCYRIISGRYAGFGLTAVKIVALHLAFNAGLALVILTQFGSSLR